MHRIGYGYGSSYESCLRELAFFMSSVYLIRPFLLLRTCLKNVCKGEWDCERGKHEASVFVSSKGGPMKCGHTTLWPWARVRMVTSFLFLWTHGSSWEIERELREISKRSRQYSISIGPFCRKRWPKVKLGPWFSLPPLQWWRRLH